MLCNSICKMKIGIGQINTIRGDFKGNKFKILNAYFKLLEEGADLVIFPELAVCGYPPKDLLLKPKFLEDIQNSLNQITKEIRDIPAIIGTAECVFENDRRILYNSAAWCKNGNITKYFRKSLLPNYDVFDELRYFNSSETINIIEWNNKKLGITICEDIWANCEEYKNIKYKNNPIEELATKNIDMIINLSASPWYAGKEIKRQNLIKEINQYLNCPVIYCNAVGGNDELIFDGESMVVDLKNNFIEQMPKFKEAVKTIDFKIVNSKPCFSTKPEIHNIHDGLVLGLRDYINKSGFKKVLIGLSGGIDSAVVASLAKEAIGSKNILGISMPSIISSRHSIEDARILAENLNIDFKILPMKEPIDAIETNLLNLFKGKPRDISEENIQARIRGLHLMAVSNKFNRLVLTTGNKSELSVGYCTLYGDMCGGLAVISDVPKMKVYELAAYINKDQIIIPMNTINKPPSAELSPDQKDEDSLPPYPILDSILDYYIRQGLSRSQITSIGFNNEQVDWVVKKVDQNEYKRTQAAPGLKISQLAFGVGRRMPIVQKYLN